MLGVVWLGLPGDVLPEPPDVLGALGVLGVLGLLAPVPVTGSPGAVAGPLPLTKSSHAAWISLLTLGKETPPELVPLGGLVVVSPVGLVTERSGFVLPPPPLLLPPLEVLFPLEVPPEIPKLEDSLL